MFLVFLTMPRKNLGLCLRMFNTILGLLNSANSLIDRLCLRFCIADLITMKLHILSLAPTEASHLHVFLTAGTSVLVLSFPKLNPLNNKGHTWR